ncbi:MAG: hypothetical protein LBS81_01245 [Endomicrobium sp.]|jgi:hypothetical protein|nr:hypothetical protein [Endomicrobium sp.]
MKIILILLLLLGCNDWRFFIFKPSKQTIDKEAVLKPRDLYSEFRETGAVVPRTELKLKLRFLEELSKFL